MDRPQVFISYSWDSDQHCEWVEEFATRLREENIESILDRWHLTLGDQLPAFMENSIRESQFVLIICTPKYKEKSNARKGGVGYEGGIIQAEVFTKGNHQKYIPILREGDQVDAFPTGLLGKYYVNLKDEAFETGFAQLVDNLLGRSSGPPPIGKRRIPKPSSPTIAAPVYSSETREIDVDAVSVGFSTDARWLGVIKDDGRVDVYDLRTLGRSWELFSCSTMLNESTIKNARLIFTPNGKWIVIILEIVHFKHSNFGATVWKADSRELAGWMGDSMNPIYGAGNDFIANAKTLAVQLCRIDEPTDVVREIEPTGLSLVHSVEFSSKSLFAVRSLNEVSVWDLSNGEHIMNIRCVGAGAPQFSGNAELIAVPNDGVEFFRTTDWSRVTTIRKPGKNFAFSDFMLDDGFSVMATISNDIGSGKHTISIWDVQSGKQQISTIVDGEIHSMQLSPDGKTLAWCEENAVKVWRLQQDSAEQGNTSNITTQQSSATASLTKPSAIKVQNLQENDRAPKLIPIYTRNEWFDVPGNDIEFPGIAAAFRNDVTEPLREALNVTTHLIYRHKESGGMIHINEAVWIERGQNSMDIYAGKTCHLALALQVPDSKPPLFAAADIAYSPHYGTWINTKSHALAHGHYDLEIEIKADNYRAFFKCEGELGENKNVWTTPVEFNKAHIRAQS